MTRTETANKVAEQIGGATQAEIKAWKERYGENKIHLITIPEEDGEEELEFIARTPDRTILAEVEKWSEKDPNKAKEILINTCVLTRKEEIKSKDYYFLTAYVSLSKLIRLGEAKIKNL